MLLELILVRHGLSCANTWKKRLRGMQLLYSDPELTEHGISLCEERRPVLREYIDQYFPNQSYKVAASSLMRTQQTAYHMLLKHTSLQMNIVPHIAETGFTTNNSPAPMDVQHERLGSAVVHHIAEDHRGKTDYYNKSDWNKFLTWVHTLGDKREQFFYKTEFGVYCGVVFTHGHFMRQILKVPKVENNDMFFVTVDLANKQIVEQRRLTEFSAVPAPFSKSTDGCRIRSYSDFVYSTRRKHRLQRQRTRKYPQTRA